ncbi:signal peptidase II [Nocardioides bruguierae]|uniref:Lipoprotein signal peptidase n=1 Tax=Nocardioides bruguierae TaxID=2945102 RepID=A0A9X2IFA0_9ACTN|nr:signal peptidase II [Nocardioides bruguierae]MCL8027587.1 signal peptidase II [Nocardioides bruguierae]MCM0621606.1 signal peptidase II [Nocardioides bruguierae]
MSTDPDHGPDRVAHAEAPRPSRTRLRLLLAAVAVVGLGLDQVTKQWATQALADGDRDLVGSLLRLNLLFNPGAAFSTGTQFTVVLTCLAMVASVVVVVVARRVGHAGWAVALGLLLAGITGNLTDRIFREPGPLRGHVVDFLQLPHWPVFNVADICITSAAVLIVLLTFRGVTLDGSRVTDADESKGESTGESTVDGEEDA